MVVKWTCSSLKLFFATFMSWLHFWWITLIFARPNLTCVLRKDSRYERCHSDLWFIPTLNLTSIHITHYPHINVFATSKNRNLRSLSEVFTEYDNSKFTLRKIDLFLKFSVNLSLDKGVSKMKTNKFNDTMNRKFHG